MRDRVSTQRAEDDTLSLTLVNPYSSSFLNSSQAAYFFLFLSFDISRFLSVRSILCPALSALSGRREVWRVDDHEGFRPPLTSFRRHITRSCFSPLHAPDHL